MHRSPWLVALHLAALSGFSSAVPADVNRANEAYDRGNYDQARSELSAADTIEEPSAQFLLGVMHANGQGVAQNRAEAVRYFRLAEQQGYAPAREALNGLGEITPVSSTRAENASARPIQVDPTTTASYGGGTALQLGAFGSLKQAKRSWSHVSSVAPELTADMTPIFASAEIRGTTYYRLRIGPFDGEKPASARCNALKAKGALAECFVVKSQ